MFGVNISNYSPFREREFRGWELRLPHRHPDFGFAVASHPARATKSMLP